MWASPAPSSCARSRLPRTAAFTISGSRRSRRGFSTNSRPATSRSEEAQSAYGGYGGFGESRFDQLDPFASGYTTPGWQRARAAHAAGQTRHADPKVIEGELVAREDAGETGFDMGERVFHQKFGYGKISSIDGNKLTIDFEKAGRKRVLDSFVERH